MKDFEIQITYDKEMKELTIRNENDGIYSFYHKIAAVIDLLEALKDYVEEYSIERR